MFTAPKNVARLEKKVAELEARPPSQIIIQPGAHFHQWQNAHNEWHFHTDEGPVEVIAPEPIPIKKAEGTPIIQEMIIGRPIGTTKPADG